MTFTLGNGFVFSIDPVLFRARRRSTSASDDLPSLYSRLKDQTPNRVVWYSPYRSDWFVLAGRDLEQNYQERHFYIRVETNGVQLRGFSISYKADQYPNIAVIIAAMSFTFDPFPASTPPSDLAVVVLRTAIPCPPYFL
jgi:hypothetical protein